MMITFMAGKVVSHNRDKCPTIHSVQMLADYYDDVILSTSIDLDLPPKPDQPVVM